MKTRIPLAALCLCLSGCTGDPVQTRITDSLDRLAKTEGGQLLAESIEAHGGLNRWFTNGDLHFRWTYRMRDRGPDAVVDTNQIVDPWSAKAVHEVPGTDIRFGWNGSETWISPPDAEFSPPPKFWALTPYYFVGIPFVLADPGTKHEMLGEIEFEGTSYPQVKVTFEEGTGQSPDDYYIALIDPETSRVAGVRYIVTHPAVAKEGATPEKLITYEEYREVDGVWLPGAHRSFTMNEGQVGEEIRDANVSEVRFLEPEEGRFEIPENAKVY